VAELIVDEPCLLGENPLWHSGQRRLYWTDIVGGRLFSYDPASQRHECVYEGEPVSGFTIQRDGSLLLFMTRGSVKVLSIATGGLRTALDPDVWFGESPQWRGDSAAAYDVRDHLLNDVIADESGRVFVGVLPVTQGMGGVYSLDSGGKARLAAGGILGSNGLAFTRDRRHLLCTDSSPSARRIYRYAYDVTSGRLSRRSVLVALPRNEPGLPDGLTVDADGYAWSARWDGGCIVRYCPEGAVDRRVELPVSRVTSVAFGGVDYRDMYITTASFGIAPEPGAGGLFRLRAGGKGRPEFRSDIRI